MQKRNENHTSIKQPPPSSDCCYLLVIPDPTRVFSIAVLSIKWSIIKFLINLVWLCFRIYMMEENTVGDGRWQLFAAPVACLFQNKVLFLLKIVLIYDEPLLSGQPPLSSHFPLSREWPAPDEGSTAVVCWQIKVLPVFLVTGAILFFPWSYWYRHTWNIQCEQNSL